MANTRAKFVVKSVSNDGETGTIKLSPVTSGSEENKEFFKYTPGGEISLQVINPEVTDQFEEGDEFYVDFTKVEKPQETIKG